MSDTVLDVILVAGPLLALSVLFAVLTVRSSRGKAPTGSRERCVQNCSLIFNFFLHFCASGLTGFLRSNRPALLWSILPPIGVFVAATPFILLFERDRRRAHAADAADPTATPQQS